MHHNTELTIYEKLMVIATVVGFIAIYVASKMVIYDDQPIYPMVNHTSYPDDITMIALIITALVSINLYFVLRLAGAKRWRWYVYLFLISCLSYFALADWLTIYNQRNVMTNSELITGYVSHKHIKGHSIYESLIDYRGRGGREKSYLLIKFGDDKQIKVTNMTSVNLLNEGDMVELELRKGKLGIDYVLGLKRVLFEATYRKLLQSPKRLQ